MALTRRDIREACAPLEAALQDLGAVSAEALAALRPGRTPAGAGDRAWLQYYGELRCRHNVASGSQAAGSGSQGPRAADEEEREAALAASLAAEPVRVRCDDGETRAVHPKGRHALGFLSALDQDFRAVSSAVAQLADHDVTFYGRLTESLAVRLWAWVLCTPGSELPFGDVLDPPDPPRWTEALTLRDIDALYAAHLQVHGRRLALMATWDDPDPDSKHRLPLDGFLGHLALEKGLRPYDVVRRWSLGEHFAASVSAARAQKLAEARADAKRETAGG